MDWGNYGGEQKARDIGFGTGTVEIDKIAEAMKTEK